MWERLSRIYDIDQPATLRLRGVHRSPSGRYWIPRGEVERLKLEYR